MKATLITTCLVLGLSLQSQAQNYTSYIYSYNCTGCGTYTVVSADSMDLETTVNISSANMPDTGTATLAVFNNSASRKAKEDVKGKGAKNHFTVYPNPTKGKYFLYFETDEKYEGALLLQDMYGRTLSRENISLKKGMNVFERKITAVANSNYLITAIFNNKVYKQRIAFSK